MKTRVYHAWDSGFKNVLLVLPTGGGKTVVLCSIVSDTLQTHTTAIMVHRKELVQQICLTLSRSGIYHNIIASRQDIKGIIAAERRMFNQSFYNAHATVSVISVDTLIARKDVYTQWVQQVTQVITDEAAHVLRDNKWGTARAMFVNARSLGVTATPERLDRKGLGSHVDGIYDVMIEGPPTRWMIDQGYLSKYKIVCPPSDFAQHLNSKTDTSDYSKETMINASKKSHIVGDVVENYIKFANGKQAILFATDINTAYKMEEQFKSRGITAKALDGTTKDSDRLDALIRFRDKEIQVLINVDLFDEGLDVPGIEVVIMARPTKSLGKYLQMCLDEDTEILTKRGWLKHGEMSKSDIVAGFNITNEEIEWCEVEEVFRRDREIGEDMFTYKSPHVDIRVTSQHDMVVKSRSKTSKNWKKEIVDISSERKDCFQIPVNGIQKIAEANITDDELNFIGWFLSDGTRVKNHYSEVIRIYQCTSENHKSRVEHIRKTLKRCRFKFSECEVVRKGELANYNSMIHFTIMKDTPVRNFKGWEDKTGWSHLDKWLDKSIPEIFDTLSERQVGVLLNAINLGDGNKNLNRDYTPQTLTITTGDNLIMADRLQSLLVRRGYRCNLTTEKRIKGKAIGILHIKKVRTSSISGVNAKDGSIQGKKPYKRARFVKETNYKKEIVWCVKNRLGTIITRRNGKVAILGNCGRGLRIQEGKEFMLLIDHVGNVKYHDLPCKIRRWTLDRTNKRSQKINFVRICSNITCNSPYDKVLTECPWCGEAPPKPDISRAGTIREALEIVEGDLVLLDPAVLRNLESRVVLEDPANVAKRVSDAVNPAAGLKAMRNQQERIATQAKLVQAIAEWAGVMKHRYKYTDRQIHKKFYMHFMMTITEALAEPKAQMEETIIQLGDLDDY